MSPTPTSEVGSGNPGYLMLLRGQRWEGYSPAKYGPLWNYRLLPGRAGDAGTLLFFFIQDRTWSALGCPEWARVSLREFCEFEPHKSARAIRFTLKLLERIHLIERDPKDPWRFKSHPENIANAPLRVPVRHPNAAAKKRNARSAAVAAPLHIAALRSETSFKDRLQHSDQAPVREAQVNAAGETCFKAACGAPIETGLVTSPSDALLQITPAVAESPSIVAARQEEDRVPTMEPVSTGLNSVSTIEQRVSPEGAANVLADETYCPWNWTCPFLISDIAADKPLSLVSQTLDAGRSAPPEEEPDRPTSPDQVKQIRKLLREELIDKVPGDDPSEGLCHRIHRELRGAPLEWVTPNSRGIGLLRHRIRMRYSAIQSYGFVERLSQDVGKQWLENRAKAWQKAQAERAQLVRGLTTRSAESFRELHESYVALKELAFGAADYRRPGVP